MNRDYRLVNIRDYVVALCVEYNVSIPDDGQMTWEAEDRAYEIVEAELKKHDIEEMDIYSNMEMQSLGGYIIKVKANLIVPAVASDYDEALSVAETFVDNIKMPSGITGISIGTWDSQLKKDKSFLMRCKGA